MIILFCEECDLILHNRNANKSLPEEVYSIFDSTDILKYFQLLIEECCILEKEFIENWNEQ